MNPFRIINKAPWKKIGKATVKVASVAVLGGSAPVVAPEVAQQVAQQTQSDPSNLLPIIAIVCSAAVALVALIVKRPQDD
jgi:uncharacterized protein YjeT (DUF2065 family)